MCFLQPTAALEDVEKSHDGSTPRLNTRCAQREDHGITTGLRFTCPPMVSTLKRTIRAPCFLTRCSAFPRIRSMKRASGTFDTSSPSARFGLHVVGKELRVVLVLRQRGQGGGFGIDLLFEGRRALAL